MRQAARRSKIQTASVPAPVGGLNARDSIANMAPTDAIVMDNWVPGTTSVSLRLGYTAHATGFASPVYTVATYNAATTHKIFAGSGTSVYDATAAGAVGAAVMTGFSNVKFQHANFGNVAGQYLYLVNGADKARLYNGTTWFTLGDGVGQTISSITHSTTTATLTTAAPHGLVTGNQATVAGAIPVEYNVTLAAITVTGANTFTYVMASAPASNATTVGTYTYGPAITSADVVVTSIDTALFKDVQIYAERVWFVEKNSFRVWYLGVKAISGPASPIDLSSLFRLGGSLQGMVVWTVTSELSSTSYAGFLTSEGEMAIYAGTNPDSADAFVLAGTFRVGKPIGQRFYERVGSDTVLITEDGIVPMSRAAFTNRANQSDAVSYKIMNLINTDIQTNKGQFGWDVLLYPLGNKIICNAPHSMSDGTVQYVMNTITNQWCRYTGLPAYCWSLAQDNPYFGSDTAIFKAESGTDDNGAGIAADLMPAFSYFRSPGTQKIFTAVRPIITANGNFNPAIGLSTDFKNALPTSSPTLSQGGDSAWDTSPWDISSWSDFPRITTDWQWVGGVGFSASVRMKSLTKFMAVELQSFDYAWERSSGGLF